MNRVSLGSGLQMAGIGAAILLTGCSNFFVKPTTTTTSTGTTTGSTTSDYAYVVNSNSTISEFVIGSGALTAISGSPFAITTPLSTAASVVVNPANTFVYVGGTGGILAYSIGTTGALSLISGGGVTEEASYSSLAVSPNGSYLLGLDNINNAVWVFSINASTGAIAPVGSTAQLNVAAVTAPARMLAVAPSGNVVAVAEGTGGDDVFGFNESTGVLTAGSSINPPASGYTDLAVAFDPTSAYLLVGRGITAAGTSQVLSYNVGTTGILGTLVGAYNTGVDPYSILVDQTGAYVYTANRGAATISGFGLATGVLTPLTASPFVSGGGVTSLAEDVSNKYVIAAAVASTTTGPDTSDLTMYSFDALAPGQLDAVATSQNGSGVAGSVAIATTHP